MTLKPEYMKIYEDSIFHKKEDGTFELKPHDKEDAEFFYHHLGKELGKSLEERTRLNRRYRPRLQGSENIIHQIEKLKDDSHDIQKKLEAIKLWAENNNAKLQLFESDAIWERRTQGFEERVNDRIHKILSDEKARFAKVGEVGSNLTYSSTDTPENIHEAEADRLKFEQTKKQSQRLPNDRWEREVIRVLKKNKKFMKFGDIQREAGFEDLPVSYTSMKKIFRTKIGQKFLEEEIIKEGSYYKLKNPDLISDNF